MQFCRNYLFKNHCSGKYGTRTRPNASKAKHQHGHRFNPRGILPRAGRAGAQLQSGVGERTGFGVAEPLGMRQIPSCPRGPKSGARLARRAKDHIGTVSTQNPRARRARLTKSFCAGKRGAGKFPAFGLAPIWDALVGFIPKFVQDVP